MRSIFGSSDVKRPISCGRRSSGKFAYLLVFLPVGNGRRTIRGGSICVGIIVNLAGLTVSPVLKEWKSDVPSIVHAWRLRRAD
jgi:hypothetical protein